MTIKNFARNKDVTAVLEIKLKDGIVVAENAGR